MSRYLFVILIYLTGCTTHILVPQTMTSDRGEVLEKEPSDGFYISRLRRGHTSGVQALDILEIGFERGRYVQANLDIVAFINSHSAELQQKCGHRIIECKKSLHKIMINKWIEFSGFEERLIALREARLALDEIKEKMNQPEEFTLEEATNLSQVIVKILVEEVKILKEHGIKIPPSVAEALEELSFFARLTLI